MFNSCDSIHLEHVCPLNLTTPGDHTGPPTPPPLHSPALSTTNTQSGSEQRLPLPRHTIQLSTHTHLNTNNYRFIMTCIMETKFAFFLFYPTQHEFVIWLGAKERFRQCFRPWFDNMPSPRGSKYRILAQVIIFRLTVANQELSDKSWAWRPDHNLHAKLKPPIFQLHTFVSAHLTYLPRWCIIGYASAGSMPDKLHTARCTHWISYDGLAGTPGREPTMCGLGGCQVWILKLCMLRRCGGTYVSCPVYSVRE